MTFVAASGDSGFFNSHQGNQVGVEWPASDPNVLSVGGTTLSATANGSYLGESAWNLYYNASQGGWWGGGGGFSGVYAEPSYQYGVQRTGVRTVPDVAYNAGAGVWIYDTLAGGWQDVGGTSAGAPQWAGLIAEVNQGRALVGLNPLDGASQTLPGIYQFSSAFHDITSGSNGYSATPGYNLATGLGTPIAYVLAGDLAFHFSSNYDASHVLVAASSFDPLRSVAIPRFGMSPLLAVEAQSALPRPSIETAAHASMPDSSTQEPLAISLAAITPTKPLQSIASPARLPGPRHWVAAGG